MAAVPLDAMKNRLTTLAVLCVIVASPVSFGQEGAATPALKTRERVAPWGVVAGRWTYYERDGKEVLHGLEETFSAKGELIFRYRYEHGLLHGLQESFYEEIGQKESESHYVKEVEHGVFKTWAPNGELLFQGAWRDGTEWDGWFDSGSSSGSEVFHEETASWKIVQWKEGKRVAKSERTVRREYRSWEPGRLPDHRFFSRRSWAWYGIRTTYKFYGKNPTYADVPFLIEHVAKMADQDEVAYDQLMALTRMQFGIPRFLKEDERKEASEKWRKWWKEVGQHRPALRAERGVRDRTAWDLVRRGRDLPMPPEPIVLPKSYTLTVTYSSGDYDGVINEALVIRRQGKAASLVRRFSTHRRGPVREERCEPFKGEESDQLVQALGYLIDRPWLLNDEAAIEKRFSAAEKAQEGKEEKSAPTFERLGEKIVGRESYHVYYPNVSIELRDEQGKVWWNADPIDWHGPNPGRFNQNCQPADSTVFPFLAARYPEGKRRGQAEWVAVREGRTPQAVGGVFVTDTPVRLFAR